MLAYSVADPDLTNVLKATPGMFRVIMHDKEGHAFPQPRIVRVPDNLGGFKNVSADYYDLTMAIQAAERYNNARTSDFSRFDVYNDRGELIPL